MSITVVTNEAPAPSEAPKPADANAPETSSAPSPQGDEQVPAESDPASEKPEGTETDTTDETEGETGEQAAAPKDGENGEKPAKKGGFQRRIDKLNAQKSALQAEAEHWKQQALKSAPAESSTKPAADASAPAGKPDPETFQTHTEYVEALTEWKLDQRLAAERVKTVNAQRDADHAKRVATHSERMAALAKTTPDFAEALENMGPMPVNPTLDALIVESENSAELVYALAKEPDEAKRIASLPPSACARELGRFEARLGVSAKGNAPASPEPKKITQAPKPIAPVGGTKGTVARSLQEIAESGSLAEYEAQRRREQKKRSAASASR